MTAIVAASLRLAACSISADTKFDNARPLRPSVSSPLPTRRRGSPGFTAPRCSILDVPGLGPPRALAPDNSPLSRLGGALHRVLSAVFPVLASAELARRGAVTLCMLCLVRIGHYIPVPGIDLAKALGSDPGSFGRGSLARALTGCSELPGNVFLLSIMPLMSAYFGLALLQIWPDTRRHFLRLREEGRSGRETVQAYTSLLFLVSAVIQATEESGRLVPLMAAGAGAAALGQAPPWAFRLQAGLSLMAGAVMCKHFVQTLDHAGLGDGTGVVIGAGIALGYSQFLRGVAAQLAAAPPHPAALAAAAALCGLLVAVVVWVQGIELRLPLTFYSARRAQAPGAHPVLRALAKGIDPGTALEAQSVFPMRLSPGGTRQLLFANFWVGMLEAPLRWLGLAGQLDSALGFAALVFLLEAVSVGDTTPRQLADFLAQSDAGLKGLSPGLDTERFLARRRQQLKLLNAAFIAAVSLAARGVDVACAALTGAPFGCLSLLLLVSTVLGAARQVDAYARGPRVDAMIAAEWAVLDRVIAQQPQQQEGRQAGAAGAAGPARL